MTDFEPMSKEGFVMFCEEMGIPFNEKLWLFVESHNKRGTRPTLFEILDYHRDSTYGETP